MKIKAISQLFVPATDSSPDRYVQPGETLETTKEKAEILIARGAVEAVTSTQGTTKKKGA